MDQRTQSGGGGHAAGEGAQIVEQGQLQHEFRDQETNHHWQQRHGDAVDEVDGLEILDEVSTAGDTGASQEEHQTQLTKHLQNVGLRHQADGANVLEMSEQQTSQQTAAGGGQREVAEFQAADGYTDQNGQRQRHQAEIVHLHQLALIDSLFAGVGGGDLCPLRVNVGLQQLGHQLYEQHHAHNAKQVSDAVAGGDRILQRLAHSALGSGEGGGGGKGTGEQTGHHGGQLTAGQVGGGPRDQDAADADSGTGGDNDQTQQDVGCKVLLEIRHEAGARDKTNGGDEEHQAKVFNDLQAVFDIGDILAHSEGRGQLVVEEAAKDQRGDEHAGGAEGNALDGDAPQQVAHRDHREQAKHHEGNARRSGKGKLHIVISLIYNV